MKSMQHLLVLAATLSAVSSPAAVGTLSGPYTARNLQIFLVHGDTRLEDRHYSTLSEALAKGLVEVRETGRVNELAIVNRSKELVFLNAGDIVKGGRQDRTVKDDLILPPFSGEVPLAAFCVEHGRWTGRGHEKANVFSSNSNILSSRKQKLASRYENNQSDVWAGVAEQQALLNSNVGALAGKSVDVRSPVSASSLQLSLEDKDLYSVKRQYLDKLEPILDGKTDVIGFVYAINGEINTAEVYDNKSLFRALWPKLLDSAVTEAISDYRAERQPQTVEAGAVRSFFETAVSGSVSERSLNKATRVKTYATPTTVLFETIDEDAGGIWLHKSFINKGQERVVVPLDRDSRLYQNQMRQQLRNNQ
jgi:ARG and Rhodanese-Phosphatase-superfamily-associated Protein domain